MDNFNDHMTFRAVDKNQFVLSRIRGLGNYKGLDLKSKFNPVTDVAKLFLTLIPNI